MVDGHREKREIDFCPETDNLGGVDAPTRFCNKNKLSLKDNSRSTFDVTRGRQ